MEQKVYVNKNMIRTKHNVSRVIYFESELERERFILLYEDMIDAIFPSEYNEQILLGIKLPLKSFNEIVKSIGLTNVPNSYHKTRYWRTEKALV